MKKFENRSPNFRMFLPRPRLVRVLDWKFEAKVLKNIRDTSSSCTCRQFGKLFDNRHVNSWRIGMSIVTVSSCWTQSRLNFEHGFKNLDLACNRIVDQENMNIVRNWAKRDYYSDNTTIPLSNVIISRLETAIDRLEQIYFMQIYSASFVTNIRSWLKFILVRDW